VEASIFLAEHLETQKSLGYLITLISRNESAAVRKRFIASIASRHGEVVSVIARSPLEDDAFDFGAKIDPRTIALICRSVLRMARDEVNQLRAQRNFSEYLTMKHHNIEFEIIQKLRDLNKARLGWVIAKDKEMYDYQILREKLSREKNSQLWLP
jgi:hypothetical protein